MSRILHLREALVGLLSYLIAPRFRHGRPPLGFLEPLREQLVMLLLTQNGFLCKSLTLGCGLARSSFRIRLGLAGDLKSLSFRLG